MPRRLQACLFRSYALLQRTQSKALLVHIVHVNTLTPVRRKDALRRPEVFSPIWVETILADE
jgi:hypothetical protein